MDFWVFLGVRVCDYVCMYVCMWLEGWDERFFRWDIFCFLFGEGGGERGGVVTTKIWEYEMLRKRGEGDPGDRGKNMD